MPIVSRQSIGFANRQFARVIKVDTKGMFSIELPPEVAAAGFGLQVTNATQTGAIHAFNAALKAYAESMTTAKRVICYQFKNTSYIWSVGEQRVIYRADEISFAEGTSLSLAVAVYDEFETLKPDGSKSYRYEEVKSAIPQGLSMGSGRSGRGPGGMCQREERQIPHSIEAEAFFARIGQSMETLILTLSQGFKDPTKVATMIEGGAGLRLM